MPSNKPARKSKRLQLVTQILTSSFTVGIGITLCFVLLAKVFYDLRSRNEEGVRSTGVAGAVFQIVQGLDFILSDTRLMIRGVKDQQDAKVALLAIDDESIKIIGRWPWPRAQMAELLNETYKNGAKVVGLDVIWSEPQPNLEKQWIEKVEQTNTQIPAALKNFLDTRKQAASDDDLLKTTIETHKDKIVLGVFPSDENRKSLTPYTDYCRNEAFNRVNGDQFVKIDNFSFLVEDKADLFETLKFNEVFEPIFASIRNTTILQMLRDVFKKTDPQDLTTAERSRLMSEIEHRYMNYCNTWLTRTDSLDSDSDWKTFSEFFGNLTSTDPEVRAKSATGNTEYFVGLSPEAAIQKFKDGVLSHPVPQYESWTINLPQFHEVGTYSGAFMADQDDDGKIRRNPLFYRTGNRVGGSFIPSLGLQTYLAANPGYQAVVEIDKDPEQDGQKIIRSFKVIDINKDEKDQFVTEIPVDNQGRLKINYAGPGLTYPYIPAKELLTPGDEMFIRQRIKNEKTGEYGYAEIKVKKAEFLKDRSLILGATATGVYDLRVTPFDKNFPGPETHLTVLDNLLTNEFIKTPINEAQVMLWGLLGLGILLSAGVAFTGPILGFMMVVIFEAVMIWSDQFLLKKGIVMTSVLPALLVLSLYLFMTLYKYFTEERKKKQLRTTFSKYVSPAIVDEILEDPDNIELGGRKQHMTVFFSDVRGFTTMSEKLDPRVLTDVLNEYLTPMTQIVFNNKGTLDKYMGDALMAFFGAPISYPDHAAYACRAALQNLEKLKEIQVEFGRRGLPHIDIGIGINTAEMNVGNMGSEIVRNYTVMGDGVNLGSRLEGINKEYGTRIIISEFTRKEIGEAFCVREIDWVRVKGKNEPVRIFELISEGKAPESMKDCLLHFEQGFVLYHQKNFGQALEQFELALKAQPMDNPSELFVERCREYLTEAPPENWDGVYVMKTK